MQVASPSGTICGKFLPVFQINFQLLHVLLAHNIVVMDVKDCGNRNDLPYKILLLILNLPCVGDVPLSPSAMITIINIIVCSEYVVSTNVFGVLLIHINPISFLKRADYVVHDFIPYKSDFDGEIGSFFMGSVLN